MTRTKKFIAALCLALGLVGAIATPAMADKQKPGPGADTEPFSDHKPGPGADAEPFGTTKP